MQELIEFFVRELVDSPEEVSITPAEQPGEVTFEVRVAQPDLGKVIGKHGRTANALRTVARVAARHERLRGTVEIIAPPLG